jgi:undecaprenyl-diphosphatase
MGYVIKLSPHMDQDRDAAMRGARCAALSNSAIETAHDADVAIELDEVPALRLVVEANGPATLPRQARGQTAAIPGGRWGHVLTRADQLELRSVRYLSAMTRFRTVRSLTLLVNLLGNGWIYPPILLAILLSNLSNGWTVIGIAFLATAVAHALYAVIKRRIARPRPCEKDPGLSPLTRALDRYSFPSGHCMTLTAVLVPLVRSVPDLWPAAIAALCILAWCRLAAAHHYPSDTLAGIGLGAAVATPFAVWLIPV